MVSVPQEAGLVVLEEGMDLPDENLGVFQSASFFQECYKVTNFQRTAVALLPGFDTSSGGAGMHQLRC